MEANSKKKGTLSQLLDYTGNFRGLTYLGLFLSAVAMIMGMIPYICIWLVIRDLISVAPDWTAATDISGYGWWAFIFAVGGIIIYFAALMCTHVAAFRTAANIRKQGIRRLMNAPLGFFDNNASGLLRSRIDVAAGETETLMAHNLADIVGTITMFVSMVVLMFVFDWRMGLACLIAAIISIAALCVMMTGKNAGMMKEYMAAQDIINKAGTEYVRGIPVVKVFQQTVYSFKAFRKAIEDYSDKAGEYTNGVCRTPQTVNLTFTEGAFVFLVPAVMVIAPSAIASGNLAELITNFAFYAVFSAIISTALARIMFASSGIMMAGQALGRINEVMNAPQLEQVKSPQKPKDNSISFDHVSFAYEGSDVLALDDVTFDAAPGQTIALVGPSGGGKTTAASLIPRFWDAKEGSVKVGGVDVREIDQHELMDNIAFVFQNNHLFKTSILENVRVARPNATDDEVYDALKAAQCMDIIDKLPTGVNTVIGSEGTHLSGGEQQRISLARAIIKDAPIVVLDEATAFADPENEALIQKAFAKLTSGKTVIMVAHRLSTVVGADKIIVLDRGKVAEEGTHKELLEKHGMYADMWENYNRAVTWRISSEEVR